MKVIIAGGSGLIGRALTDSLTKDGHEVIILSRAPEKVKDLPHNASAVKWDARTPEGWVDLVEGAEAIVNFAGASLKGEGFIPGRWTRKRKELIRLSRINIGQAVSEAIGAAKRKPKVLLQASAVGYYGPRRSESIAESEPPGSDFLAQLCVEWEKSTAEVEGMGVRRVILRTGLPLTTKGGAFPLLVLPFHLFTGNWFGSGQQYYPWIHIDDHITALRFLIDNPKAKGAFNLSSPNPVTNREFARTLGKVMRRPVFLPIPRFALNLALGEVSTVVMDGQRMVPEKLLQSGFKFRFPELEPALRNLLTK
ncbi:MAG: TIGR01777 family oxidoreductase [Anaerolineales bacterium]